ncbi:LytTR family DNA-binding domain-containing protein [Flavobacterium sp.]|jgi:DNA-binding LytR/AlgR family response regulator|uniref:LytR/AlgR family response regulator transcription factor n=1 Tax=Flavobacterium sp. TaxID=239 RepID=UPI0008CEA306|nr:LytTR family DNA-binding domain-containing protein [Flavobacterium sp.]OGS64119.1 MAG: DNA-binding response regulator [Flavobacteria bacterium GWA2_35_26]HCF02760.1 DNA-binding response regulator [Flavobacterium sp.]
MNIIIIEDEKPAARLLERKIEKLGYSITTLLHSVEESLLWFQNNSHPDLIFLDIQLSDGLSFEIFEKIDIKSAVIFTTAYDEYALRAFKLNSIDYLLKPIDEEELATAISKFANQFQVNSVSNLDFEAIKRMLVNPISKEYRKRFSVKIGQQIKVIDVAEIECLYSENKGTYIHTSDNRDYLIDSSLEVVEAELNPNDFFRISRKYIIPLQSVKEIQVYSNSRLKISLPTYKADEVIVARERVSDFKEWLG